MTPKNLLLGTLLPKQPRYYYMYVFSSFPSNLVSANLLNKGGCMGYFHSIKFHHKVSVWLQSTRSISYKIVLKCVACQARQATKEECTKELMTRAFFFNFEM
jgi:hypothetical protein